MSNEQEQTTKNRARDTAARASIDAKVSIYILLTGGTIFDGNPFCTRTLLRTDFILMSRIFSLRLKKIMVYITTLCILFRFVV